MAVIFLVLPTVYPQGLEQCLTQGGALVKTYQINERKEDDQSEIKILTRCLLYAKH